RAASSFRSFRSRTPRATRSAVVVGVSVTTISLGGPPGGIGLTGGVGGIGGRSGPWDGEFWADAAPAPSRIAATAAVRTYRVIARHLGVSNRFGVGVRSEVCSSGQRAAGPRGCASL